MLESQGHQGLAVGDGGRALELLQQQTFDAVVLDLHMPVLDGLATAAWIREHLGEKRPGIVVLSATLFPQGKNPAEQVADVCLTKPVTAEQLADALVQRPPSETSEELEPALAVLDLNQLHQNIGDDPEFLQSVLGVFLEETRGDILRLQQKIEEQDHVGVRECAHKLKGACLTMGALRVANLLARLEAQAQLGTRLLAPIQTEWLQLQTALSRSVGEL